MASKWCPPSMKVLPAVKPNYKGKNMRGGRKAVFSQSRAYKGNFAQHSIPWSWITKERFELP
jgi:hypothetical protein